MSLEKEILSFWYNRDLNGSRNWRFDCSNFSERKIAHTICIAAPWAFRFLPGKRYRAYPTGIQTFGSSKFPRRRDTVRISDQRYNRRRIWPAFLPSLELYKEAVLRGWDHAGLPNHPIGLLMSNPRQNPHSSLAQMGAF